MVHRRRLLPQYALVEVRKQTISPVCEGVHSFPVRHVCPLSCSLATVTANTAACGQRRRARAWPRRPLWRPHVSMPSFYNVEAAVDHWTIDNRWSDVLPPVLLCYTTAPEPLCLPPPLALVCAIALLDAYLAAAW